MKGEQQQAALKANATERSNNGRTPLHLAAGSGYLEVVNRLLEMKVNATERRNDGWTPLHSAAENGHLEVVNQLLEMKANATERTNDRRRLMARIDDFHTNSLI